MAGDTLQAESRARDFGKRYPVNVQVQSLWLPTIQAQLAINQKNPTLALKVLRVASPIELANIQFTVNASCLYRVYVRGEAYLALGQGGPAADEFQKIIDHSGIVWNCWTGALARREWPVRMLCRRKAHRERMPMRRASVRSPLTRISLRSGKTPTRTSPS